MVSPFTALSCQREKAGNASDAMDLEIARFRIEWVFKRLMRGFIKT